MNLKWFHGKVGENYAWEVEFFINIRRWKDGITFFNFSTTLDRYPSDHNPKFELELIILNLTIIDFTFYNVWHMEHEQSPYYGLNSCGEKLSVVYHSHRNFYQGKNIYWYQLMVDGDPNDIDDEDVPVGFLRVPGTKYFEFGGELSGAINQLTSNGFSDIVEGEPI